MRRRRSRFLILGAALAVPAGLLVSLPLTANAAAVVTATFTKTQDWGSGYEAGYTVTNNTSAALSSWTVTVKLPASQQMGTFWDALQSKKAASNTYTFANRAFNGALPANGGTASFGFIVDYTGKFAPPMACSVNGKACAAGTPAVQAASSGAASGSTAPAAGSGSTGAGGGSTAPAGGSGTGGGTPTGGGGGTTAPAGSGTPTGGGGGTPTGTPTGGGGGTTAPAGSGAPTGTPTGGGTGPVSTGPGGGGGGGGGFATAPYVDLSNNQEPMLDAAAKAGLHAFTAAFVTGAGCTPIWGDTLPVTNDPTMTGLITKAEGEGAQPIVSFGGAAGIELAQSCPNVTQLTAAYQSVINTLHVSHIDFDIEGAATADTASNNVRYQAINNLERANPGLSVSVTIPVLQTGPVADGIAFLQQAASNHTSISVVNVMAMDYGGGAENMGAAAVSAAQGTLKDLQGIFPGATFGMIGVTPMIGINDDSAENFTQGDAQTLVNFAQANHLGRLAFWSVDRDQPCAGSAQGLAACSETSQSSLAYTKIFDQFTG